MPWYLYISMCIMYIVLTSHGGFLGQWEELEGQRRRSSHPVVSSVWFFTLLWRTCSMSTSQTGEACVCPHGRQLCTLSHCRRSLQASHVYAIGPVGLTKPCSNFFRADLLAIHVYIFLKTLNMQAYVSSLSPETLGAGLLGEHGELPSCSHFLARGWVSPPWRWPTELVQYL